MKRWMIYLSGIIATLLFMVFLWLATIQVQRPPVSADKQSDVERLRPGDHTDSTFAVGREDEEFFVLTDALFETLERVLRRVGQQHKYGVFNFKLGMEVNHNNKGFAALEPEHKGKIIADMKYSDAEVIFWEWNEPNPTYQNCLLKRAYIWVTAGRVNHLSFVLSCQESDLKALAPVLIPFQGWRWEEWHGTTYYIACLGKQHATGSWVIAELAPAGESSDWILSYTVRPCFFDPDFTLKPLYNWHSP